MSAPGSLVGRDDLPDLYGDVVAVWKRWTDDIRGASIPSGRHMAEEAPEALAHALDAFFGPSTESVGRV